MAGTDAAVAIYWDFENVHACLVDDANGDGAYRASRFKVQEPIVDIDPITEYASTFGRVVVHRAYANWQYFGRYRDELQAHAIDLAQLFPLAGSKNGADIRLVLDVAEDLQHHPHLTHVIVVASDSDYTPLAQRCRKNGRYFHGVGTERTASSYRFACDEFRRYRDLAGGSPAGQAAQAPADAAREVVPLEDAGDLVVRAIRRLAAGSGESWVRKAGVRPLVKRLDPTFDESGFGYPTFTELLRALDAAGYIAERPGEYDHEVAVRAELERGGADGEERGRTAGDWAAHERPAQDAGGLKATALAGTALAGTALAGAGLAGAGLVPGGPWQPASASAVLIERQLRRRGLRLPTKRRVLWDLPDLMVAAFAASPDGTAASFEDLRLAVEDQAPADPGAEAGPAVPEADFNKVKSILLHARAFTLLGRDRGISLQVPDAGRLRALIVGQLLRHLADPGDEEPAVLAEAFFGPSASEEQRELVATVLRTPPAEAAAVGPGAGGTATVVPAPREAGHLLGDVIAAETPAQ